MISPNGKRRIMMAQSYGNPMIDDTGSTVSGLDDLTLNDANSLNERYQSQTEQTEEEQDLVGYIFQELTTWGYLPRRLKEFKDDFLIDKTYPDGTREVELTLPSVDANGKSVSNKKLKQIADDVQGKFELYFDGAERSKGKLNIKFTSINASATNEDEQEITEDGLSKAYGGDGLGPSKPSKPGKASKSKPKKAYTINELIKSNKDDVINKLISKLAENKYAS